jgi:adenosylcobinamide kinase / adenosylcobinamide-phosphate guanylyltransferase
MSTPKILITGPSRSGKSEWAETLAFQTNLPTIYIATSSLAPDDPEWCDRIAQHQQRRPPTWQTLENPPDLAATLETAQAQTCLLIDSLGTWIAPLLDHNDADWATEAQRLCLAVDRSPAHLILVAEEVGWGVVPAYPMGRLFRDRLGSLTRQLALRSTAAYLVTAGYALNLKNLGRPVSGAG